MLRLTWHDVSEKYKQILFDEYVFSEFCKSATVLGPNTYTCLNTFILYIHLHSLIPKRTWGLCTRFKKKKRQAISSTQKNLSLLIHR